MLGFDRDGLYGVLASASAAYINRVRQALDALHHEAIVSLLECLLRAREEGRTVFVFGNGGSAATASHMASDLTKGTIRPGVPRLRAFALTDNVPVLTAWSNDTGFDQVFSEQLKSVAREGDVAIAISGSGNSPNVVAGIKTAQELGLFTVGLLGFDGGKVRDMVDLAIVVPIHEYGPVEDIHLLLNHLVTTVMNELPGVGPMEVSGAEEAVPA